MIKKIEHLGIAVKSIEASLPIFEKLLGKKMYKTEIATLKKLLREKILFLKSPQKNFI